MDHPSTPPVTASSTAPAPTMWKQGAGVGTAIGTAISTCIGLGLGSTWVGTDPNAILFAVAGVMSTAVVGMTLGALIGWAVPAQTQTNSH